MAAGIDVTGVCVCCVAVLIGHAGGDVISIIILVVIVVGVVIIIVAVGV